MEREIQTPIVNQKESISLKRNAKGDYQWDIKLIDDEDIERQMVRLERINAELESKYIRK